MILSGRVCFGVGNTVSPTCAPGVESLTTILARLRFNVDFAPFAGFSLGVSGAAGVAGAASSRARALVDRRGSVILGPRVLLIGAHGMHVSIEKL